MRTFPTYIQHDFMDCGPTCLKIIASYWGKDWPLSYLKDASETTRLGSNLIGLSKAAEDIGLRSLPVKTSFEKLKTESPFPCIVHWKQNHFVVVYKITRAKVLVSDPGAGLITYSYREFLRFWIGKEAQTNDDSGIALLVEPTLKFFNSEVAQEDGVTAAIFKFIKNYFLPYKNIITQVLLTLLAGTFLQLLTPILTQNIIDVGIRNKDIQFIWLIMFAQIMVGLGQLSMEWFRNWLLLFVNNKINLSLLSDFFIKLMRLPLRFFDVRLSGDLMQRLQDHYRIQSFLTNGSLTTIFSIFTFVTYGAILVYYNASIFAVFIGGSILYIIWILFFLRKREQLDYKKFQEAGLSTSIVFELINGMQEIKLNNSEHQKRWSWERNQIRLFKISMDSLGIEQLQSTGSRIINEIKNCIIYVLSASLVVEGKITLGMMLAISYIIGQLNTPVIQFVSIVKGWQDTRISMKRILEIHAREEEGGSSNLPVPIDHSISLENVSFRYSTTSPFVLKEVNLVIPDRKVTAIVGTSGSGKTTLMKLLMSFYKPEAGKLMIGNVNFQDIDLYSWRKKCGVVMQEGFIFNETIESNIAMGDEPANQNRLIEAAKVAAIYDFINDLPLKFKTKIGAEGIGLSTGQKQRILIARAVYKNPQILLFDEATSALDANTEKQIIQNLKNFFSGRTVLIIAHRLSTVKNADNIIVLENGEIVEYGNHSQLTRQKGRYFELVKNQLELGN